MKTTITISIERAVSRELERLHRITGCSSEEICARAITKELGLAGKEPDPEAPKPKPKANGKKRGPDKLPTLSRAWRFGALELIALSDAPASSTGLARALGASTGAVCHALNDLVADGFIEISTHDQVSGARIYAATEKGIAALEAK